MTKIKLLIMGLATMCLTAVAQYQPIPGLTVTNVPPISIKYYTIANGMTNQDCGLAATTNMRVSTYPMGPANGHYTSVYIDKWYDNTWYHGTYTTGGSYEITDVKDDLSEDFPTYILWRLPFGKH